MTGDTNMADESTRIGQDDGDLARLLAATGTRNQPSERVTAEVRAAVEAEWRRSVSATRRRHQYTQWAIAAGVAVAAVALWVARPLYLAEPGPVASVARVIGDVQVDTGDGRWTPLAAGSPVKAGTAIRTDSDGLVALSMTDGVALRLDSGTRLVFRNADEASLSQGAVYVDSGPETGAPAADFLLETPRGSVRHLGTQYQARLAEGNLRVGIREGHVEVSSARGDVLGGAGELLVVGDAGAARSRLASTASEWKWVNDVTPPFSIEGRSVDDFLSWAGRETGRRVVYSSPVAAQQARSVTLRGTVEGLPPDQAVVAVLSTTTLRPSVEDEQITIDAPAR
jgi:ferric-dicitrate binding protein FerR (iron transport regulator)